MKPRSAEWYALRLAMITKQNDRAAGLPHQVKPKKKKRAKIKRDYPVKVVRVKPARKRRKQPAHPIDTRLPDLILKPNERIKP